MDYENGDIERAQEIKANMTVREKINFLNTLYEAMPGELKPGMTKRPQKFHFVKMHKPHIGEQKDTFGVRLIWYRHKYHLSRENFCNVCNECAARMNTKVKTPSFKPNTRITMMDLRNYEDFNVSPKIDKMTLICKATGMSMDYFAGYGPRNRRG